MKETLMNRLTWMEYQERVRDEQAPVFLPVGALEQHGPHCRSAPTQSCRPRSRKV